MRYQDQIVRATQKALEDLLRSVQAVPADKLDWVPMGSARPVISQMQEIAMGGSWFLPIVKDLRVPEFDAHAMQLKKLSNDTLDKCMESARQSTSDLCAAIEAVADEDLEKELHLPFGGGMTVTVADLVGMHYWNLTYHLGQVNQVQLMLGDGQMH